ncbi:hypothetical protein CAter282_0422 [Collimonas arenae]|uniref:Uncharacterized protein n=1 Tax=Collimonas arenae TaxID=279058 RepID=A0A127QDV4_9BURK|nr:hypothetical protein CAter282_0422 [Collimonas arenae]
MNAALEKAAFFVVCAKNTFLFSCMSCAFAQRKQARSFYFWHSPAETWISRQNTLSSHVWRQLFS